MVELLQCSSIETTIMADQPATITIEGVASSFQISARAADNYINLRDWEAFEKTLVNPWTLESPEGVYVTVLSACRGLV